AICNLQSAIVPIIADIRFPDRIRAVFEAYRPESVFHAGAHKHVPLMESNEVEALTNPVLSAVEVNVLGMRNVVEAAVATGAERFLMISTDKAVNPTSVMGASKRVAKLVVTHAGRERGRQGDGETAPLPPNPGEVAPPKVGGRGGRSGRGGGCVDRGGAAGGRGQRIDTDKRMGTG
ncbi:MAG: hypothetical protein CVU38_13265, partial [Chloroflexi bacterium HGW-Chloroflexi-1]